MSVHELDRLIKIEKGLLSFNRSLPDFLYAPIKVLKWEKFFTDETKVKFDVVDLLYATKFHPKESYAIVDDERVPFTEEKSSMSCMVYLMIWTHTLAIGSSPNPQKKMQVEL